MNQRNVMPSDPYIQRVLESQDLEKIKFSQQLRQNATEYNELMEGRVDQIADEVGGRKRTAFQKAYADLGRYMDMDHNAGFYNSRNTDVNNLLGQFEENNMRILNEAGYDKDISKRQFEINEYFYHNKLETLFFLQVFFIATLAMGGIIYAGRTAMITAKMAGLLTMLLVAIVAVVGVSRYFYTRRTRDHRLWHRRYFPKETPAADAILKCPCPTAEYADIIDRLDESALNLPSGITKADLVKKLRCTGGTNVDLDLNKIVPRGITQCAEEAGIRLKKWQKTMDDEIAAYQTAGTPPTKIADVGSMCSYRPDWSI